MPKYCACVGVIEDHLAALEANRYSPATVRARRRVLSTLPDPLAMDRDGIQAWWTGIQTTHDGTPRAAASLAASASHVRAFYRDLIQRGIVEGRNPADWLPTVRQASTLADPLREADLVTALRKAPTPVMHRAIALGALAGLRSAEIAVLRWEDIDRTAGVLWVRHGKGAKDRSVPLSGGLLAELGDPGEGLIVTGPSGAPMSAKAVSAAVGRYLRSLGIENATAHKLRARYATRFLAATGDLASTARALGHASVLTTQRYVLASSDTMRAGAEACGRVG